MASIETADTLRASRRFVKAAMKAPYLAEDEERSLAERWRDDGDEEALHALTTAYMRLVVSMAGKFRNYGLPTTDLIQEGAVGLMQAAARFDPGRGVRFSTYASWWIRASIQDFVLRNWSIVRTGTTSAQKSLFFNLRRLRALINDVGDANLTPENRSFVAERLKVSEQEVAVMASRLSAPDRSLNAPLTEDGEGATFQDYVADDRPLPEDAVMLARDSETRSQWLKAALDRLSPRELLIIQERRLAEEGKTLAALGEDLGISKERVRQIEHQALGKLRKALEEDLGDPQAAGVVPDDC
jgi:RNA polymerase sigma-32 factor